MTRQSSSERHREEEEAIAWCVRLNSGDAEEADWKQFTLWLEVDRGRRDAFDRAESLWRDLDDPALKTASLRGQPGPGPRRPSVARRGGALQNWWAVIPAGAAAAAAWLFLVGPPQRPASHRTVFETATGERRTVRLADGTRVGLNARSRIEVDLSGSVRSVSLTPGSEAAFDVQHDAARPFVVAVGDSLVRVVGTEFVIDRQGGELSVSVRRGVVQVEPTGRPSHRAPARLVRGQQLVHLEGSEISRVRSVAPDDAFGWTAGRLVYRDALLGTVAADLNRYLSVPIKVDASAASLRLTGVMMVDNEGAVVRRLQAFLPVVAERTPDAILLRARARSQP